jgi:hypothetical protein
MHASVHKKNCMKSRAEVNGVVLLVTFLERCGWKLRRYGIDPDYWKAQSQVQPVDVVQQRLVAECTAKNVHLPPGYWEPLRNINPRLFDFESGGDSDA